MILRLAAVCETAEERPDGRLDLIGIFHELSAPGFPAVQERMTAIFLVEWEPDDSGRLPLRADLLDETGRKVLTIQGHTDVEPRAPGRPAAVTRLVMPLERVVFPVAGRYRFELLAGGNSVEACSFHVGQLEAQRR